MQYITAAQAAEKWGITARRVQDLCRNNQIHGATRWGRDWMIPDDAHRPTDRRRKQDIPMIADNAQLPRKNPVIIMSNLYSKPGTAEEVACKMEDMPAAAALFRSQLAYLRGDIAQSREIAEKLLQYDCGHDLQIGCGVILAKCALYSDNSSLWKAAKKQITSAPCHSTRDRFSVDFWRAAAESELRETSTFPLWFTRGSFDILPGDTFPTARFYYLRYLYLVCHEYAMGRRGEPDAQGMMSLFHRVAEPLISQNHKEGALISEIYTRLICASSYHDLGKSSLAAHHLDVAIQLALPDKLYMPLAEYRRQMDFLMDERLVQANPTVLSKVKALNMEWLEGWTLLQSKERGQTISNDLTIREREVAKHAVFGLSNKEIAERLGISVNTVKQSLRAAMGKTGALRRSELSHYI